MKPNDNQLDELLRDVPLPDDWHARLKGLLNEQTPATPESLGTIEQSNDLDLRSTRETGRGIRWRWTVAASLLLAIAAGALWFNYPRTTVVQNAPHEPAKTETPVDDGAFAEANARHAELQRIDEEIANLERKLAESQAAWETKQARWLSEKITELEQSREMAEPSDLPGLTLVLAAETAMLSGLSAEFVKPDLHRVVELFPNTPSADRATEILMGLN